MQQSVGWLMSLLAIGVCVFTDGCRELPYLHAYILKDFTLDWTIKAKVGFERILVTCSVSIGHYQDNGRFGDDR